MEGKLTVGFGARAECIGPEFTFGITMEKLVDGPILLIKTAWGGKSLHTAARPAPVPKSYTTSQLHNFPGNMKTNRLA